MRGQVIPAFIAALLQEGVRPVDISAAVARVLDINLGQSIIPNDDPLVRAFAFEQATLLEPPRD